MIDLAGAKETDSFELPLETLGCTIYMLKLLHDAKMNNVYKITTLFIKSKLFNKFHCPTLGNEIKI